jgi:Flp pilus assembly protein TadD
MILALLIAFGAAAASPAAVPSDLQNARQAVAAGRLDQARLMIGKAVAAGVTGADLNRALADLAYASGNNAEALVRYQQLLSAAPTDPTLLERSVIAAFKTGDLKQAAELSDRAVSAPAVSWRAWNARGAIADLQHDWPKADDAYERARQISPQHAEIANNQGWSHILRGNWGAAVGYLETAAMLNPALDRVGNNLELARAGLAAELPSRQKDESDAAWAARLNDAGIAAQARGDRKRAIAAFSQALEASGTWYERAANNLQAVSGQ